MPLTIFSQTEISAKKKKNTSEKSNCNLGYEKAAFSEVSSDMDSQGLFVLRGHSRGCWYFGLFHSPLQLTKILNCENFTMPSILPTDKIKKQWSFLFFSDASFSGPFYLSILFCVFCWVFPSAEMEVMGLKTFFPFLHLLIYLKLYEVPSPRF